MTNLDGCIDILSASIKDCALPSRQNGVLSILSTPAEFSSNAIETMAYIATVVFHFLVVASRLAEWFISTVKSLGKMKRQYGDENDIEINHLVNLQSKVGAWDVLLSDSSVFRLDSLLNVVYST